MVHTPGLFSEDDAGSNLYYAADALGSSVSLIDNTAYQHAVYEYDAFGNVVGMSGDYPVSHPLVDGFAGGAGYQEQAGTGGLVRCGNRYYNPLFGRFVSQDPAGAGMNWYAYCGNDPEDEADPTGLDDDDGPYYENGRVFTSGTSNIFVNGPTMAPGVMMGMGPALLLGSRQIVKTLSKEFIGAKNFCKPLYQVGGRYAAFGNLLFIASSLRYLSNPGAEDPIGDSIEAGEGVVGTVAGSGSVEAGLTMLGTAGATDAALTTGAALTSTGFGAAVVGAGVTVYATYRVSDYVTANTSFGNWETNVVAGWMTDVGYK